MASKLRSLSARCVRGMPCASMSFVTPLFAVSVAQEYGLKHPLLLAIGDVDFIPKTRVTLKYAMMRCCLLQCVVF